MKFDNVYKARFSTVKAAGHRVCGFADCQRTFQCGSALGSL